MRHQILTLILVTSIINIITSQNYWIRYPSPTTHYLNKFVFTDTLNGWAVGDSGVIIHTSNGGNNWVIQNSTLDSLYSIFDVFFLNQRLGWCIAYDYFYFNKFIIKTTNGGINWNRYVYQDSIPNAIYFIDSLNGFVGEVYGTILKTTDGGVNWIKCNFTNSFFNFRTRVSFQFFNSQKGVVSGGNHDAAGLIYNTTDSGWNWVIRDSSTGETINDLAYLDSNTIIAAGGDFEFGVVFSRSSNGGFTWRDQFLPFLGVGRAIAPRTKSEFWIPLYSAEKWALSLDSGITWSQIQVADSQSLNYTKFIDPYHGWTVGSNGAIYKYNTAVIGINNGHFKIPLSYRIFQNYPNPFNPSTAITFEIPKASNVIISVFDVNGRLVSKIIDNYFDAGSHQVVWDGSNMSSGVYFYRIESGSFSQAKKMIQLK
jgi:photosystem II stability/assembly factor-like uncharacterized protein